MPGKHFVRLRFVLLGFLALVSICWVFLRFFLVAGMDPEETEEYFSSLAYPPESRLYEVEGLNMHYQILPRMTGPTLFFIHGSPGSWDAFVSFFVDTTLTCRAQVISVDRIGYGLSEPGRPEPSLHKQAALLRPVLEEVQLQRPVILIGHSYGGPVALQLAIDYPDWVDGVLLVAALTDPALEERMALQETFQSPWLRWILPRDLDVSNREIVPLKGELQKMEKRWGDITAECYLIQGGEDILVEPENADFAEDMLVNTNFTTLRIPQENHFIPWTNPQLIKRACIEMMDCLGE